MDVVFLKLLNMSLTGCVLILAVLVARILLKKAPRWSVCLLWALVAVRLTCPFSLESSLSLVRDSEPITRAVVSEQLLTATAVIETAEHEAADGLTDKSEASLPTVQIVPETQAPAVLTVVGYVWLGGCGIMLLYAFISYCQLKHRVSTATRRGNNVRESEYVTSPFVLGLFRPVIYLPYGLKQPHLEHVLAHERSHIRRGDHLIKPLAFCILAVHWFNPLVWVAYILLCRDIEAACDEHVIKDMTKEQRQAYSATLLRCSIHRRRIAACPVAFGETGVKQRIKGIMSYQKPVLWIVIAALLIGGVVGICFLTEKPEEPVAEQPVEPSVSHRERMDELLDELVDFEDRSIASNPERCVMLNREAYEELLSYDELALSYFIPKLRKADIHSYREHMMVRTCAELTGVAIAEVRMYSDWYMIPQLWVAEYDRCVSGSNSHDRLRPGIYETGTGCYDELYWSANEDGYSESFFKNYMDVQYYVTADSFIIAYPQRGLRKDYTHGTYDISRQTVQWKWQSPDPSSALYTEQAKRSQKAMRSSLDFIHDEDTKQLLSNSDCLFQPLKYGNWLVLCGDRLFLMSGAGNSLPLTQVEGLVELLPPSVD
jgi:beta-lactamase regulating signal transducer with metallopeptidase domain